jgi:hypothetical protein
MNLWKSLQVRWKRWQVNHRVWELARKASRQASFIGKARTEEDVAPVAFFNASTRLVGVSQNAAFALLAAAGLQAKGIPVVYFACHAGMKKCALGTQLDDLNAPPPCQACKAQSRWLLAHAPVVGFEYKENPELKSQLEGLSLHSLMDFVYQDEPLGQLVLASMRWVLRKHHLDGDEPTRQLYREYILSAWRVGEEFEAFLQKVKPRVVVVFNGMFFPEAVARYKAQKQGLRVITHEVGLMPLTGYFTHGQATAYPLDIPDSFQLGDQQNKRLDQYLEQRFQGKFSMAGIQFWKGMSSLEDEFLQTLAQYRQLVPVFTNVIFDTSQPHSNVVFPHMFAWLDEVVSLARLHRDTLFVIRAHPDENRMWKESRESVADWVDRNQIAAEPNIVFFDAGQAISSYELIQRAKFVMVYNSTIGLEASILGAAVLCAGRARFTQLPTVFFPQSVDAFRQMAAEFLEADHVAAPSDHQQNARRFLYFQLFRSSLPFGKFLEPDGIWPGFVRLRRFDWHELSPQNSPTHAVLVEGILNGHEFILDEDETVKK